MSDAVRHPIFARVYDRMSAKAEDAGQDAHRRELLAGLGGRVIEVGAGNGLNFKHYPATVASVLAVEPEAYLRQRANEESTRAAIPIEVVDGLADELPAEDARFDAAVASLMLCRCPTSSSPSLRCVASSALEANFASTSTSAPTSRASPGSKT